MTEDLCCYGQHDSVCVGAMTGVQHHRQFLTFLTMHQPCSGARLRQAVSLHCCCHGRVSFHAYSDTSWWVLCVNVWVCTLMGRQIICQGWGFHTIFWIVSKFKFWPQQNPLTLLLSVVGSARHHSYTTLPWVETPTHHLGFSSVLHSTIFSK